jgi:excisionase family DNA binding protein
MSDRLLSAREVATRLGCSPFTVRRLARDGEIPAVRFGEHGHLRFVAEDVDALIERRRRKRDDALALA